MALALRKAHSIGFREVYSVAYELPRRVRIAWHSAADGLSDGQMQRDGIARVGAGRGVRLS